jgi:hypothetical protein
MEGILDEELEKIKARCEAARPSPWKSYLEGRDHQGGSDFIMVGQGSERTNDIELNGATRADREFVAHARQDIPRLLAEIFRLRKLRNTSPD